MENLNTNGIKAYNRDFYWKFSSHYQPWTEQFSKLKTTSANNIIRPRHLRALQGDWSQTGTSDCSSSCGHQVLVMFAPNWTAERDSLFNQRSKCHLWEKLLTFNQQSETNNERWGAVCSLKVLFKAWSGGGK